MCAFGKNMLPIKFAVNWSVSVSPAEPTRPRSAAAAEVMWSGRYDQTGKQRDLNDAMPRIFDWRYRLVKRGIQAEALQPLWW